MFCRTQWFSGVHTERPVFSYVLSFQSHADLFPLERPELGTVILVLSQSLEKRGGTTQGVAAAANLLCLSQDPKLQEGKDQICGPHTPRAWRKAWAQCWNVNSCGL